MSTHYQAPEEVRELEKLINDFTYQNGLDVSTVFRDFLRYIIQGFSLPGTPPLTDWKYTKEQNLVFSQMVVTWIQIMNKQIEISGWYDALGDLFMALTSQQGQLQKGQFFSSHDLSELIQQLVMDKNGRHDLICDPAAGSGRLLLSSKVEHPRNYLVAWDIDYTCCLMCVCNFIINSCVGEVVCIDTLRMENFRGAWLVNEAYYRTGLPSIRWLNEQEYLFYKQQKIPVYVFFLDQKNFDGYFRWRGIWDKFIALFDTPKPAVNKVSENDEIHTQEEQ